MLRSIAKAARKRDWVWRYGFNLSSSVNFAIRDRSTLNAEEARIVTDLNRDGIAVATADSLFAEASDFRDLLQRTRSILASRQTEIRELEKIAQRDNGIGTKTFNLELLGNDVSFDPDDIYARVALNTHILNIANAYFRMYARLRYYNVWNTFATKTAARESQLWHFDREDNYILKVFIYLEDVDDGAGPFTYAPGTHRKGRHWNRQPEFFLEDNVRRSTDKQMNAVIPREKWVKAIGKKGTIVFADTRGFHKGGEARTRNRLMFTCMFTSPASDSKQLLRIPRSFDAGLLTSKRRHALQIE